MFKLVKNTFVVVTLVSFSAAMVSAGDENFQEKNFNGFQRKLVNGSYYSPVLRCEFTVRQMTVNGFTVKAARLVSNPKNGSPLRNLGLRQGDVIYRLDGVPVNTNRELENHYSWTTVRYCGGNDQIRNGKIYIESQNYASNDYDDDFNRP